MEIQKNHPIGKIPLNRYHVINAVLFFIGAVVVMSCVTILKFVFVDKLSFTNSAISYILYCAGLVFIMFALFIYTLYSRRELVANTKALYAVNSAIIFTYFFCLFISMIDVLIMPIYLVAFIVAPISKRRDAFLGNLFCIFLTIYTLLFSRTGGGTLPLREIIAMFIVGITGGTAAAYLISGDTKRSNYILKGLVVGTSALAFILLCLYADGVEEGRLVRVILYAVASVYSPIVLGLVLQPLVELAFNLVTNSRLVELTDHNSKLIKMLRTQAPGTFNHCQAVANFAELCATAIGENPYLARACAYYHDIGKLMNPQYYKENQGEVNPHDQLLPEVSADIIRSHTTEGLRICNENRIPYEVSHVTVQHHGTLLIPVFYNKAKQLTDSEVDPYEYSYHGVTPVTKVAAIIMLCDTGEAAIRAMTDPDGEKVDKLLTGLIRSRIEAGQFDNCDISLRDLDLIKQTIINAYGGLFHKRLQYPSGK